MPKSKQRVFERFHTQMPALLMPRSGDDGNTHRLLLTRDISSGGAYFYTREPVFEGKEVQIEILIPIAVDEDHIHHLYLETQGEVTRRESEGVAVRFTGDYKLRPFS